jgi:hypothetical protein
VLMGGTSISWRRLPVASQVQARPSPSWGGGQWNVGWLVVVPGTLLGPEGSGVELDLRAGVAGLGPPLAVEPPRRAPVVGCGGVGAGLSGGPPVF